MSLFETYWNSKDMQISVFRAILIMEIELIFVLFFMNCYESKTSRIIFHVVHRRVEKLRSSKNAA